MVIEKQLRKFRNLSAFFAVLFMLSGCLGDDEKALTGDNILADSRVSGSVGDGPVVGAQMRVLRNDGTELTSFESNANATYNISVTAEEKYYPLTVTSNGGTDIVTNLAPDFDMESAVFQPRTQNVANVNPFSTIAVETARRMSGGVTESNVDRAQDIVSIELNSGLAGLASSGPMATHIDEHNIAEIVKASETLGESIRRTRDLIVGAGFSTDAKSVVIAIASDLTDERVDGRGAPGVSRRIAAVSTIVYAQVLMEAMANELHVNGSNASGAMASAVDTVSVRTPTKRIGDLLVTNEMIAKARVGLAAAYMLDGDPRIADLHSAVSGLQSGMDANLVRSVLPSGYRTTLQNALAMIGGADNSILDAVNDIARSNGDLDGGGAGPMNRAPMISGTPPTMVGVDASYSFTPTASDADGDSLSFSISNKPIWAAFSSTTGRLSGNPVAANAGTYSDIVITVSDGELQSSLSAFSVTVFDGNVAPSISGSPRTTVTAGQGYVFAPSASDPNGDSLTFSISNKPAWASFNSSNGRLSGAPTEAHVGVYSGIVVSVTDGEFTTSIPTFSITVETAITPNETPVISGNPPSDINAGRNFSFTPTASDGDGDSLTFAITNRPSWANFNTSNGRLSGTPGDADIGTYSNIRITVSDGRDTSSIQFSISVNALVLGSVSLSWTPPTENEDGSTLTDLAGYKIYWAEMPGIYSELAVVNNSSISTYVVDNIPTGTYDFVATSFNSAGVESAYSNPANKDGAVGESLDAKLL